MPTPPTTPAPSRDDASPGRGGGDACPGALRLHAADDGALARVRIPGGVLTVPQANALADAAHRLGDGSLHLTSRGNVQLRGLPRDCGAALAELLDAADLLPSYAHERVRNVVASPLSGLDGRGLTDVRPWLRALDALLCGSDAARSLSGRFLFALDDGRGDVAALGADVTLRAAHDGGALLHLGAQDTALLLPPAADAPRAALHAAEAFLTASQEYAGSSGGRAWRIRELPAPAGQLIRDVEQRLTDAGIPFSRQAAVAPHPGGPPLGILTGALSLHAPLGRISPAQWRELTAVAARVPDGELRLTPWRGIVVPLRRHATPAQAGTWLARLVRTGLVADPASPWPRVGACIGRPGCAKSLADVRADAAAHLDTAHHRLPQYWSGCERRCGRPPGDHVDVVATPDGYEVSTVRDGQRRAAPRTTNPPTTVRPHEPHE